MVGQVQAYSARLSCKLVIGRDGPDDSMKTSILARYISFEELFKRKSTLGELTSCVAKYSRGSVVDVCAISAILLKIWDRGGFDIRQHDLVVSSFFEPVRASSLIAMSRLPEPQYVFHRRQLLLLIKLALLHGPDTGVELVKEPFGFGDAFLMANDQFHFGLTGSTEKERLLNTLTEFVPSVEYSGLHLHNRIARAYLILRKISLELSDHADFINIPEVFESLGGIPLDEYFALWFGLLGKYTFLDLQLLQKNWQELYVFGDFFRTTQIPPETAQAFLDELSATPEDFKRTFAQRDYGSNDFTAMRSKPLVKEEHGTVLTDMFFLVEKIETGPYWKISQSSYSIGDRLRRFWGPVFERYMSKLLGATCDPELNTYVHDPRYDSVPGDQVCDGLMICGETAILLEYKSNIFSAESKYSGDSQLLAAEIGRKLVVNEEGKPKGVSQLAHAIRRLFAQNSIQGVRGVSLGGVKSVFPVLITLDSIGRTLLMSRYLNEFFQEELGDRSSMNALVYPVMSIYIEDLELLSAYFKDVPFSQMLLNWFEKDPKLISTVSAIENPAIAQVGVRRNQMLEEAFDECYSLIMERLGLKDVGNSV